MINADKSVILCQDILATRLTQIISARDGISPTDAIRKIMASLTYDLLLDPESFLYLESVEYILDMYDAEQRGDWERWMEA